MFREVILPQIQALWNQIKNDLLPALKNLWDVLQPVVIPVLKVLGAIIGGVVIVAITALITALRVVIGVVTIFVDAVRIGIGFVTSYFKGMYDFATSTIPNMVSRLISWFKNLPKGIKSALSSIESILTRPFRDAWRYIEKLVDKIKDGLDKINPFHRESPSLVDNVKAGVSIIKKEFGSLSSVNIPSPAFEQSLASAIAYDNVGGGGSSINQDVNIYVDKVGDQQDVEALGREFGFRAGLLIGS